MQYIILGIIALVSITVGTFSYRAGEHSVPHSVTVITATSSIETHVSTTTPVSHVKSAVKTTATVSAPAPVSTEKPEMTQAQFQALMQQVNAATAPAPQPDYMNQILDQQKQEQDSIDSMIAPTRARVDSLLDCENKITAEEANVRAEIQAAGGYGTESQVHAMATSRVSC